MAIFEPSLEFLYAQILFRGCGFCGQVCREERWGEDNFLRVSQLTVVASAQCAAGGGESVRLRVGVSKQRRRGRDIPGQFSHTRLPCERIFRRPGIFPFSEFRVPFFRSDFARVLRVCERASARATCHGGVVLASDNANATATAAAHC
jgi:hypothetical protein